MNNTFKAKNGAKLRAKCEQLATTNKQLSNKCRQLSAQLTVKERHCYALNSTVDLYQKLVQHLKTELSLLRCAQDLNQGLNASEPEMAMCVVSDHINSNDDNAELNATSSGVYECDQVANGYETDIKLFKLECDVLSNETFICFEVNQTEQLLANQLLSDNDNEDDNDDDNHTAIGDDEEEDMDLLSTCDKNSDISAKSGISKKHSKPPSDNDKNEDMESVKSDNIGRDDKWNTKCKYCGRKFEDQEQTSEHRSLHQIDNKIKCLESDCNYKCESKHDFKEHIRYHKRNKAKTEPTIRMPLKIRLTSTPTQSGSKKVYDTSDNSTPKRKFNCLHCDKVLSSIQSLKLHQKTLHNIVSSFVCKYCSGKFEKVLDLRAHELMHKNQAESSVQIDAIQNSIISNGHKESQSNHTSHTTTLNLDLNAIADDTIGCVETKAQKVSPSAQSLRTSSEPEISPYFANITQVIDNTASTDSTQINLTAIEELTAVKTKNYVCEICGRSLLSRSGLKSHIKQKHTNNDNVEIGGKKGSSENAKTSEKCPKPRKRLKKEINADEENRDLDNNLDMESRLQILSMFYAEQQKQVLL